MTIKPWTERFPDPEPVGIMRQLATLRFMQDEIDDLRKESAWLKERIRNLLNELWSETNCECSEEQACRFARERDEARAELAAIKQQKPVGNVTVSWYLGSKSMAKIDFEPEQYLPEGTFPLYLTQGAKP